MHEKHQKIKDLLRDLWKARDEHSEEWAMIVNFASIAISQKDPVDFTEEQFNYLQEIIDNIPEEPTEEDVDSAIQKLEELDFDPMAPFNGLGLDSQ